MRHRELPPGRQKILDRRRMCDCNPPCPKYRCSRCKKFKPFCDGGDDAFPGRCDDCFAKTAGKIREG